MLASHSNTIASMSMTDSLELDDAEQLNLRVLPRRRMQRTFWRRILLMVFVQFFVTLAALALLQSSWRREHRTDHGRTLTHLAADLVADQFLHERNKAALGILQRIEARADVAYVAVIDNKNQVVIQSGSHSTGKEIASASASVTDGMHIDALRNRILYETPIDNENAGAPFRMVLVLHDLGARRAAQDGMVAASAGLLVVLLGIVPLTQRRIRRWTRGLHHLHASIRRLARNQAPKPMPIGGEDEIAYLSIAFNDMSGKLVASRRELLDANSRLEERVAQRTEELNIANTELERKNIELADLTETALRFTDDVAHEFRTPLTVIREFASITADGLGGEVTSDQTQYLQYITNASDDLAQLVDDFLDSGKLRARKLRVDRTSCTVEDLLDSVWPMLEARASGRGITLERSIESDIPDVYADIDKARRTIINLTTNAVKFSPEDSIVSIEAQRDGEHAIRFLVRDRGHGMSPEEVATLFERFNQGGEGRRSSAKGFGLGLNIVRDLVVVNLGHVSVESEIGAGSTFSFTLPIDRVSAVVEHYLECALERDQNMVISMLRVDGQYSSQDSASLRRFLSSASSPADLILPGTADNSFILVTEHADPHRRRNELLREHQEEQYSGDISAIHITPIGSWPARDVADEIERQCENSNSTMALASTARETNS